MFSLRLEVILALQGYFQDKSFHSFDLDNAIQLTPLMEVTTDYPCVVEYKIRVLGYVDSKWYTDVKEVVGIW